MIWTLGITDLHCGSDYALIPPGWRRPKLNKSETETLGPIRSDNIMSWRDASSSFWNAVMHDALKEIPKCSSCFILGDCIEGAQHKSGGSQLVTTDIGSQVDLAEEVLKPILKKAGYPRVYGVHGTAYHVTQSGGRENDEEVYNRLPNIAAVGDKLAVFRHGTTWLLQHHIGRSCTPYGKQTALSKNIINNTLAEAAGKEHDADILLFGHVHYCVAAGYPMSNKWAYTLPCLKLPGESYGRRFNDFYDVGFMLFSQEKEGSFAVPHRIKIPMANRKERLCR
jgi:hypothetical protein